MTSSQWDLKSGGTLSRAERRARFGGSEYGGIAHSKRSPNIFLYTDPDTGAEHGYEDHWDRAGELFFYTGEGQVGDQRFDKSPWGNMAVRDHQKDGRAIRLFEAAGTKPGSKEVIQRYVGRLEIDDAEPYTVERGPDRNRDERDIIVFRLRRVAEDAAADDTEDSKAASERVATEVAVEGTRGRNEGRSSGVVVRKIPIEKQNAESFAAEYKVLSRKDRNRKEAKLLKSYENYLNNVLLHATCRHEISIDGEVLYTDLFDEYAEELIEVKSSIERNVMRLALGQILDYAKALNPKSRAVLVPCEPPRGIFELFRDHGVRIIWCSGDTFHSDSTS